jgi:signal peptidase I
MKFFSRLFSKSAREAHAMCKHVSKLLNEQRDLLTPKAIEEIEAAIRSTESVVANRQDKAALEKEMENLETTANKWFKPHPNSVWRENVEVLLVALAVAMAIRTFFLQPFKIPTGSMQPTLFGVTSTNLLEQSEFKKPTGWDRVREWFEGVSYVNVTADTEGELTRIDPPLRLLIFNIKQTLWIGGQSQTIWFPPDCGEPPRADITALQYRAGLQLGRPYHKGDEVINLRVQAGDHLFVNRLSYNFCPPKRGEIIVFETKGIEALPQGQFYIKRLVALSDEHVQIGDDRHLIIDGHRLDASTPHFENVYSFNPSEPPRESQYSGHVNQTVADKYVRYALAPYFPDGSTVFQVPTGDYMVMGDNTMNSFDSRGWGPFPSTNVTGKAFFVYWPITKRFGWGQQ